MEETQDYIIEIQANTTFDVSKDVLIRLWSVKKDYVEGYVDALNLAYPEKFIHCNVVPKAKPPEKYIL